MARDTLFSDPAPQRNVRIVFCVVAFICLALVGAALYLQYGRDMQPCPLCIIQRIVFIAIAIVCLISACVGRTAARIGAGIGSIVALGGIAVASWHIWVLAHPGTSCGIDPLETALNALPLAKWLPSVFQADGMCTTPYAPLLGLSLPQWSLVWYGLALLTLLSLAVRRRRHVSVI